MNFRAINSTLYYQVCCLMLFFVAAAASFNGYYDKWEFRELGSNDFRAEASLDAMLNGTAARPYVHRQLLPAIANWINSQISRRTADLIAAKYQHPDRSFDAGFMNSSLLQNPAYTIRYLIVYGLVFTFAWIATCAMYVLCRDIGNPRLAAALAAITMILLMPYFMTRSGYLWDYPELAFMAIAAWMALRFNWWWIIPVAALATWNKESFLFFSLSLYPLLRHRNSRTAALIGTGAIGLACAAVYVALSLQFHHNPGGVVRLQLMPQLHYLMDPLQAFKREKTYGVFYFSGTNVVTVGMIVWTAWRGWRFLPLSFRRHAKIVALINFPLFLLFVYPGELRDLSMLYVTLLVLIAANLAETVDRSGLSPNEQLAPMIASDRDIAPARRQPS